jgi:hypothetical protein
MPVCSHTGPTPRTRTTHGGVTHTSRPRNAPWEGRGGDQGTHPGVCSPMIGTRAPERWRGWVPRAQAPGPHRTPPQRTDLEHHDARSVAPHKRGDDGDHQPKGHGHRPKRQKVHHKQRWQQGATQHTRGRPGGMRGAGRDTHAHRPRLGPPSTEAKGVAHTAHRRAQAGRTSCTQNATRPPGRRHGGWADLSP